VSFALIIVMLVALSMSIQNKLLQIWQQPAWDVARLLHGHNSQIDVNLALLAKTQQIVPNVSLKIAYLQQKPKIIVLLVKSDMLSTMMVPQEAVQLLLLNYQIVSLQWKKVLPYLHAWSALMVNTSHIPNL
jgi:hypothetical protein